MTTGERIKAARKRAGLTQMELSALLGNTSNSAVSQWETGTRTPGMRSIAALAKALGCPANELVRAVEPMREIVEKERLRWKARVYEKIRANEFDSAWDKLAVLQGVEFLAEALDLMEGNISGRLALADLIENAKSAYILAQEGE